MHGTTPDSGRTAEGTNDDTEQWYKVLWITQNTVKGTNDNAFVPGKRPGDNSRRENTSGKIF